MKIEIIDSYKKISRRVASIVARQIIYKNRSILGFATGSSPIGTYSTLIKMYEYGIIDFSEITTFNLDEYYGISEDHFQSYHYFMNTNLFDHVNVNKENVNIPNGIGNPKTICEEYNKKIDSCGGIDLQILGIGRNGHIGFNEPGVEFDSITHLVELKKETIEANSRFFDSIEDVPKKAITMGIKTILNCQKIILIATGIEKAEAVFKTVRGKISTDTPSSILQLHPDITLFLDEEAASKL